MIIELLLDLIFTVFSTLLTAVDIPDMPMQMQLVCMQALEYINTGLAIASNFIDIPYLFTLFGLVLAVDLGLLFYKFIIWFLKKIPFLGIK